MIAPEKPAVPPEEQGEHDLDERELADARAWAASEIARRCDRLRRLQPEEPH